MTDNFEGFDFLEVPEESYTGEGMTLELGPFDTAVVLRVAHDENKVAVSPIFVIEQYMPNFIKEDTNDDDMVPLPYIITVGLAAKLSADPDFVSELQQWLMDNYLQIKEDSDNTSIH